VAAVRIGIAGCGIAGAAVAAMLAEQGHVVTVFEQAQRCGPVGAGILLQPAGQEILRGLGFLDGIASSSSRIERLHARHRGGRTLVDLRYGRLREGCHGLGVHRGALFEALLARCRAAGVRIREGARADAYGTDGRSASLLADGDRLGGPFDLVVAADGSRSRLAEGSGLIRSTIEYGDAAMWTVGPWAGDASVLQQIVGRDGRLVGILPVGGGRASFFWGTAPGEPERIRARGFDAWRADVAAFCPEAAGIVAPLNSLDEVTFASYRSVRLRAVTDGRVAFIGDAAHAMSPHLGQGTSLALEDAAALAGALSTTADVPDAMRAYEAARRRTTAFYSRLTATLTPFFQTRSRALQLGRDLALPVMPRVPIVGREMLRTLAGEKRGWLG